jgi:hypothetical protein
MGAILEPGCLVSLGCIIAYTDRNTVAGFHSGHKIMGREVLGANMQGPGSKAALAWQWEHMASRGRGMLVGALCWGGVMKYYD